MDEENQRGHGRPAREHKPPSKLTYAVNFASASKASNEMDEENILENMLYCGEVNGKFC